ncbi:short-chain dehydrogenase/reductase SDR [Kluyveromyces marxianus]|nr:short-chain dehydrogenase/reductase SDR [Kluyveromyces marxianus]
MAGKVWFVTGASQGIGLTLVKKLLQHGEKVAATSRNEEKLKSKLGGDHEYLLCIGMDLHDEASVKSVIDKTIERFGRLDVIVNNAGYAYQGIIETININELSENFDINVFGVVRVVKAALPYLRKQRSGYILNVASIAGFCGFPGYASYSGTKFALAGISEAMSSEFADINVKVSILYPGPFRTGFLDENQHTTKDIIPDYTSANSVIKIHEELTGKQSGDPQKLSDFIIKLSDQEKPPTHVFAGKSAYDYAQRKIEAVSADINKTKEKGAATDFEE